MKSQVNCPDCQMPIESDNINISTDLAKCGHCGTITRVSSLATTWRVASTPPIGSSIELTKEMGDTVKLFIPKRGFGRTDIPHLLFIIFWLGFIGIWTLLASIGSFFFAFFSIPFWLVGFAMLAAVVNAINETQTVTMSRSQLVLEKWRPIGGKKSVIFPLAGIEEIKMTTAESASFAAFSNPRYLRRLQWATGSQQMLPAVISGSGTQYFFEAANDAEQDWVTQYLNQRLWVAKR